MADHVYRRFTNENLFSTTILAQNRVIVSSGSAGWDGVTHEIVPAVVAQIPSYFDWTVSPPGALDSTGDFEFTVYDTNDEIYTGMITGLVLEIELMNSYGVDVNYTASAIKFFYITSITGGVYTSAGLGVDLNSTIIEGDSFMSTIRLKLYSNDFPELGTADSLTFGPWNT